MASATATVEEICVAAARAARALATLDTAVKDAALEGIAAALEAHTDEILDANRADVEAGRENGLSAALLDRLSLDERRIAAMADGVRQIAAGRGRRRRGHFGLRRFRRGCGRWYGRWWR